MKKICLFVVLCLIVCVSMTPSTFKAYAMPFYNLKPKDLTTRSQFYTSFSTSSFERKSNIKLASSLINGTFLDIGEEFSFNQVVGARTEKRGFKKAHIIKDGQFVEGVGGGVCQVSTTLYNAVLLADLKVTEIHHHSLSVSYVSPSFDAMVNSGSADLKFINNTNNPIIIYASSNDTQVKFVISGEPMEKTIIRESKVIDYLPVETEYIDDVNGNFTDLYKGESRVVKYGKAGLISEGYIIEKKNGKIMNKKLIRKDRYNSTKNIVVRGTILQGIEDNNKNEELS